MTESSCKEIETKQPPHSVEDYRQIIEERVKEAERLWLFLKQEQHICSSLIIKQVIVSDRYSEFHETWKQISGCDDTELHSKINKINDEMNDLNKHITHFENEAHNANTILQEQMALFTSRNSELQKVLTLCRNCNKIEELESLRIPDFSGIRTNQYTNLTELNQQWDDLNCNTKLDGYFETLRCLV